MFVLVTGTLFLAGKELISPSNHNNPGNKKVAALTTNNNTGDNTSENTPEGPRGKGNSTATVFGAFRSLAGGGNTAARSANTEEGEEMADDSRFRGITITISDPVFRQPDLSEYLSKVVRLPREAPALPGIASRTPAREDESAANEEPGALASQSGQPAPASQVQGGSQVQGSQLIAGATQGSLVQSASISNASNGTAATAAGQRPGRSASLYNGNNSTLAGGGIDGPEEPESAVKSHKSRLSLSRTTESPEVTGDLLNDPAGDAARNSPVNDMPEALDQQRVNWLQESAIYRLAAPPKRKRQYWQMHMAPTVNYRMLSGAEFPNDKYPKMTNNWIDDDPAIGFEVGGSYLYRVTRNLTLKAGLQFNYSRYGTGAYINASQQNNSPFYSSYGYFVDSVWNPNFQSKRSTRLYNEYYQLSAPIGFELRVLGNERLQLHIGATIQPAYQLNGNVYLLTPDYRNYTQATSQLRRWNLVGGVEAFLSYRLKNNLRLQVGPEFRYQLLSTYGSQYPIQENLKGYGLKIGITKPIW